MSDAIQPSTLVPALKALMQWLTSERLDGAIIGGVAVSIRGRPRITKDVDAVVLADDVGWPRALDSAARYGLVPRIDNALDFASRSRMLLLRHEKSGVEVDVSLGGLPFEREAVQRASMVDVKRLRLREPRSRPRSHPPSLAGVFLRTGDAGDLRRFRQAPPPQTKGLR